MNTASNLDESQEYQRLATVLSFSSTIALFGGVDVLGIVIDGKENSVGISKEFETGLVPYCHDFLEFSVYPVTNGGEQSRQH